MIHRPHVLRIEPLKADAQIAKLSAQQRGKPDQTVQSAPLAAPMPLTIG